MKVLLQSFRVAVFLVLLFFVCPRFGFGVSENGRFNSPELSVKGNNEIQKSPIAISITSSDTIYEWTWEDTTWNDGWGDWWADNGIWEVGAPTVGPDSINYGYFCAGTNLSGNYDVNTDSRLISPTIDLPTVGPREEIELRFWHWFSYAASDWGSVQVSYYAGQNWSDWNYVTEGIEDVGLGWSMGGADLTSYAGMRIRIAFYHTADDWPWGEVSSGWYIDDLSIVRKTPVFSELEGFENGWGDWYADNGLWEVGFPNSGPGSPYEGSACVGIVLDGNYSATTDSRLISPTLQLPVVSGGEEIFVKFWHWFSYAASDWGRVEVSVYSDSVWGDWHAVSDAYDGESQNWSMASVDLTQYSGQVVRVGFYHQADDWPWGEVSSGWYIDNVWIYPVGVEDFDPNIPAIPRSFSLSQNYPNPFNPSTTIGYDLPRESSSRYFVQLTIYDMRGRLVKALVNEEQPPGTYEVYWDGRDTEGRPLSSGIYLYSLKAGDHSSIRRMVLAK